MARELRTVGEIAPERVALVVRASHLATLEEVLHHGLAVGWDVAEVIVQDEYTHDVIVATRARLFLVFDTT